MRRSSTLLIVILLIVLTACRQPAATAPSAKNAQVETIVAGTMQAFLSATPLPTGTPTITPTASSTPTATFPLPVPPGWEVYWSQKFGFAFAHPGLYDCHGSQFYSGIDEELVTYLMPQEYCFLGTDAPQELIYFYVLYNNRNMPFQKIVDKAAEALKHGSWWTGPDPVTSQEPITVNGQQGVLLNWKDAGASGVQAYIPYPNSPRVLLIDVLMTDNSEFSASGRNILSTVRLVGDSPALAQMSTQTAVAYAPPAEVSRTEYASLDALAEHAPFHLWLPGHIPGGLFFEKGWLVKFADGSLQAGLQYGVPGNPDDASLERFQITETQSAWELTLESLYHQPDLTLMESGLTLVHMHEGYYYLGSDTAGRNSAHDQWREEGLIFHVSLTGDWPSLEAPSDDNKFYSILDDIADSLQPR